MFMLGGLMCALLGALDDAFDWVARKLATAVKAGEEE